MYPLEYFALDPPYPRTPTVFVAMSFDIIFQARWIEVIEPAVKAASWEGTSLRAVRVDARRVSESILTEILSGISSCRVFIADISTLGMLDGHPIRNGNVMYEVGIAHATRLPEEVLLFRSDSDQLLFDVGNVRVNSYQPDQSPDEARRLVTAAIEEAIAATALRKRQVVTNLAQRLDATVYSLLFQATGGALRHVTHGDLAELGTLLNREAAIRRLLELGLIRTKYTVIDVNNVVGVTWADLFAYGSTELGDDVLHEASAHLGFGSSEMTQWMIDNSPGFKEMLKQHLDELEGRK